MHDDLQERGLSAPVLDLRETLRMASQRLPGVMGKSPVHHSISSTFRNGTPLDDTIDRLLGGEIQASAFPPPEVVEYDGRFYSLSNRRLFVYRVAFRRGVCKWLFSCMIKHRAILTKSLGKVR